MDLSRDQQQASSSSKFKDVINKEEEMSELELLDRWDPAKEHYFSPTNTLATNASEDAFASITGKRGLNENSSFLKIGDVEICHRFLKYGSCADGKHCSKKHISPDVREALLKLHQDIAEKSLRKIYTTQDLLPSEMEFNPSTLLLVEITLAKSPNDFHMVIPYENKDFNNYSSKDMKLFLSKIGKLSQVSAKVDKIHKDLAEILNHHYRLDNVNDPIYLGQVVACKMDSGRFVRGVVIEQSIEDCGIDFYKIHLLDIGHELQVDRQNIFDLPKYFTEKSPIALHCGLDLDDITLKLRKKFISIIRKSPLMFAKVYGQNNMDETLKCDLFTLDDHKSIRELLFAN